MFDLKVRVNLPNGDMVGHTGDIEATVVACKAADEAVKVIFNQDLMRVLFFSHGIFCYIMVEHFLLHQLHDWHMFNVIKEEMYCIQVIHLTSVIF